MYEDGTHRQKNEIWGASSGVIGLKVTQVPEADLRSETKQQQSGELKRWCQHTLGRTKHKGNRHSQY